MDKKVIKNLSVETCFIYFNTELSDSFVKKITRINGEIK